MSFYLNSLKYHFEKEEKNGFVLKWEDIKLFEKFGSEIKP